MKTSPRLSVAWSRLPAYGAHAIRCGFDLLGQRFPVLQTQTHLPIRHIPEILGQDPICVEQDRSYTWQELGLEIPDVFVFTGWSRLAFDSLAKEVKAKGGLTISMADTQWLGNPRQQMGCLVFRLKMRRYIDVLWMAGKSGVTAARKFGMPAERIYTGFLGSSKTTFYDGEPLDQRQRQFIYAGNLEAWKGSDILAQAYRQYREQGGTWGLEIFGQGGQRELFQGLAGISLHAFSPPEIIAEAMRNSRFFILPSRRDAWGLVLHESALCGCGIICSTGAGGHYDLLEHNKNGYLFKVGDSAALAHAMHEAEALAPEQLTSFQALSLKKAAVFSADVWGTTLRQIIDDHWPRA